MNASPWTAAPSPDASSWPPGLEALADMHLPAFLMRQRWYPAKDAGPPQVGLDRLEPFALPQHPAALAVWRVQPPGGSPFRLFVPLALLPRADLAGRDAAILAEAHPAEQAVLADAFASDAFVRAFTAAMRGGEPAAELPIRRGTAEQSNTSLRIGEDAILKVFRKLEPGIHPEREMGALLQQRGFTATPPLLGAFDLPGGAGEEPTTLAVLQGFVANRGDGWSWMLERLRRDEDTLAWVHQLGRRTAELHRALAADGSASQSWGPDIWPEAVDNTDLDGWRAGALAMGRRALDGLAASLDGLTPPARSLAERLLARRDNLPDHLAALLPRDLAVAKTRHHGDYHLGQVLVTADGGDAVLIDFEGEPLRPLAERRAKHSPLRDVAGMLRSFSYAAAAVARGPGGAALQGRLAAWARDASRGFLTAYLAASEGCPGCAADPVDTVRLIRFFMLEKALYEVAYEVANRPDWVDIPLAGVLAILEEPVAAQPAPVSVPVSAASSAPGSIPAAAPAHRAHRMPFGAELQPDGQVRFRLWAPAQDSIRLSLDGQDEPLPLERGEDGWHGLVTDRAGPGSRYRFLLADGMAVPDPASRHQPEDVHGPSQVVDPMAFRWRCLDWQGRPWEETVLYELHIGSFTPEGTFCAAIGRLDHLVRLGVTAIEIMPVADFPGGRNWGYDGVLPYAPDSAYGRPEDFKALVDAAHAKGLSVLLDVVYNHFGPEGNYLPLYAPQVFTEKHHTPWGAAVNYDDVGSAVVRAFVIHNALYWIEEFNLDGLRLDAVHAILDSGDRHLLDELAERVRAVAGDRPVHLLLENEENQASRLERDEQGRPRHYTAQWNDDMHHVLHVAATGESAGYYGDYAGDVDKLGRALAEGFAFQGEMMPYRGEERGQPSAHLPPTAFVAFLQNHDQVGNRAFGDRIAQCAPAEAVRAAACLYLLGPQIPMLFMGEEWATARPFPFFCDFGPDLADAVREGRRKEFARFPEFQDEAARARIPDPMAEETFRSATLDWQALSDPVHADWLDWYVRVLAVRRAEIVPRLAGARSGRYRRIGATGVLVRWPLADSLVLTLAANLSPDPVEGFPAPAGREIWHEGAVGDDGRFGPWAVRWSLEPAGMPDGGPGGGQAEDEAATATATALDRLAGRLGIEPGYDDATGRPVRTSAGTKRRLLAAMGVAIGGDAADEESAACYLAALDREEVERILPPVAVLDRAAGRWTLPVVLPAGSDSLDWRLLLEQGGERTGTARDLRPLDTLEIDGRGFHRLSLALPDDLPDGYHRLEAAGRTMALIVSPGRCWLPPTLAAGGRLWGLAAQLYTVRSATNWGIGDFGDLRTLVDLAAHRGAGVIGLNPLHALFPDDPEHASPYSPASRLLLNVLSIDVTAVPEFAGCAEVQALVAATDVQARLEAARQGAQVDYSAVADLKMQALGALFNSCRAAAGAPRWQAFETFRREQGERLERPCLFLALRRHFAEQGRADWHDWPEVFRRPDSPDVARFAADHRHVIDFMVWLQWEADRQLGVAAAQARDAGMEIGLYRDLAVGADAAGAETWANPRAVVSHAHVGAPPDIFMPGGQDWGLPPWNPAALRDEAYRSFIDLLRANMRHAGGLRIDHAMALQHLYWVPKGASPRQGGYVAYPLEEMVGILALESQRNRCLVVGEDLGTVPPGFRERMAAARVLSYRVLYFEQDMEQGTFKAPDAYPPLSLAVIASHDLPTLPAWWAGAEIGLKDRLGLFPAAGEAERQRQRRARDRACLVQALRGEGLLPDAGDLDAIGDDALFVAAHAFLARGRAALALAQLDDISGDVDPVNVPGTGAQFPNWRRKLTLSLEDFATSPRLQVLSDIFAAEHRRGRLSA
ncbi:malto-oligosyltrehalose trehalohydrolase [Oleisolibacter albus]|uniref:malto-oligosyltrehalose trehalohydrolase n=1 Tax=Oleisolibacter albus TaxID=2171757 RepID=UPI001960479A|nr:malto-oligosyltrehalose trehalohydrolase [Oleisolibacter albus]